MNQENESLLSYKHVKKNADTLTPIGIFKRLTGRKKFLLESSVPHEVKGKYSYIGSDPYEEIIGHGNRTTVINHESGKKKQYDQNPLKYIEENIPKLDLDLPLPFTGGAVGYIGYDVIRQFKNIGTELHDPLDMPDIHLMMYKNIIVYEHSNETAHLITMNIDGVQEDHLDKRIQKLKADMERHITIPDPDPITAAFKPQISKQCFIEKVEIAQQYIDDGQASQIVLSQRMQANIDGDPLSFYRKLRMTNPSPYMFYIDFEDYLIIGASPESLVQTTGGKIVTNPIAGTRKRGKTAVEDQLLMTELLADDKERAEHEMLVKLSEQDLSHICTEQDITIPTYMNVEKYEHVMHIVSEVHGKLKDNFTSIDALIACLPAGTVSGAPKTRAMQIINELESDKRGFYGGGIGYITFNHDLNITLAIRSLVIKQGKAYLQAGAGIVADSIPEMEYEETLHKARSLMEVSAVDLVNG